MIDPNTNRKQQLELAASITKFAEGPNVPYSERKEEDVDEVCTDAIALSVLVKDLDDWLVASGALPDAWQRGGATTLLRHVKGDTVRYKNVVWQHPRHGFYVEVYWRQEDMLAPAVEAVLFGGGREVGEIRTLSMLLGCAAAEVDRWITGAKKGGFWEGSIR